jgi:hypothetical protein
MRKCYNADGRKKEYITKNENSKEKKNIKQRR